MALAESVEHLTSNKTEQPDGVTVRHCDLIELKNFIVIFKPPFPCLHMMKISQIHRKT